MWINGINGKFERLLGLIGEVLSSLWVRNFDRQKNIGVEWISCLSASFLDSSPGDEKFLTSIGFRLLKHPELLVAFILPVAAWSLKTWSLQLLLFLLLFWFSRQGRCRRACMHACRQPGYSRTQIVSSWLTTSSLEVLLLYNYSFTEAAQKATGDDNGIKMLPDGYNRAKGDRVVESVKIKFSDWFRRPERRKDHKRLTGVHGDGSSS